MKIRTAGKILVFILLLYMFFISIELMGSSFKHLGKGFAESLLKTTSNPVVGLIIGIFTTSLIQSSSTTTSIVVGLVASGGLTLRGAIPIIMGANIGTTITNTIVSMAHIHNRKEFRRALAAATVHDFFNILAVIVLFPVEMIFHPIESVSIWFAGIIFGIGGFQFMSPLKAITFPISEGIVYLIPYPLATTIISLVMLFCSLIFFVKIMKSLLIGKIEIIIDDYLFRNDLTALSLGFLITAIIQSSSITTSMIIPLVGAGVLTVRKIYPYTLGANIGTTVTALMASMITMNITALMVALSHLTFNILGIMIFYPLKVVPIKLSQMFARVASRSHKNIIYIMSGYYLLHFIPLLYFLLR